MWTPSGPATSRGTDRRRQGRVYLSENPEHPGRFGGSWQTDRRALEELDPPVGEQEALRWARERATVVAVRTVESMHYSAGERNPWGVPEWPGLEVARADPYLTPPAD